MSVATLIIVIIVSLNCLLAMGEKNEVDSLEHHHITELMYYKDRGDYWRKQAGILSCKLNDLGPTGGFCLDPTSKSSVGSNDELDRGLSGEMSRLFLKDSPSVEVIDLGCGFGQYGRHFESSAKGIKWTGYDGSENIDIITDGFVKFIDLAEPKFLGKKYDWAMSIEVAEHLPMHLEANFLYVLDVHNRNGVVLSWAVPGQGGHAHVNCQSNEYVQCVMTKILNYSYDDAAAARMRAAATVSWLKNTVMVFSRSDDHVATAWHAAATHILSKYALGSTRLEEMHTKALKDSGCWSLRNLKGT